jgi:predicted acyltransferase
MTLRNLKNHPEKMIPVAMALIVVGISILVIGIAWPRFSPSVPHVGTNWNDFFRGFMYGLAIVLEAGAVVLATIAAAAMKPRKPL